MGMPVSKAERIKLHDDASPTMIFAVCIRKRGFTPGNLETGHDGQRNWTRSPGPRFAATLHGACVN